MATPPSRRRVAASCPGVVGAVAGFGMAATLGSLSSKAAFVAGRTRGAPASGHAEAATLVSGERSSAAWAGDGIAPEVVTGTALAFGASLAAASVARKRTRRGSDTKVVRCAGGGASGGIETFLLRGKMDAGKLAAGCAPLAMHIDLDCVVFFSLGVPPELIASVAGGSLGLHGSCPVYVADCYGIIGWDKQAQENVELMEEGRGSEYGCVGGNGGEGVVVAAFRGGAFTPTDFAAAAAGSLPSACSAHMVVKNGPGTPKAPPSGAIFGGVAKKCYTLQHSGDLEEVEQIAVSTPAAVVSSFTGDAAKATGAILDAADSGLASAVGYFPCFCRGVNKYGEDNIEPKQFAGAGLEGVPLFGMFAHGELGPPVGEPIVCTAETEAACGVEMHSMTSVMALYSK